MERNALGFIEVIGMTAAIEAADTCLKAANVKLVGYEKAQKGLVTVKIEGDVGAVKAAIEAGKISAATLNKVVSTLVIPRPANALCSIVDLAESTQEINEVSKVDQEELEAIEEKQIVSKEKTEETEEIVEYDQFTESLEVEQVEDVLEENQEQNQEQNLSTSETIKGSVYLKEQSPDDQSLAEDQDKTSFVQEQEDNYTCNLCQDPDCTRMKGQSHTLCIHNKR